MRLKPSVDGGLTFVSGGLEDDLGDPLEVILFESFELTGNAVHFAIVFEDGWLDTGAEDFFEWGMVVIDENDGDGDGVPDLVDRDSIAGAPDPGAVPIPAHLSIRPSGDQLAIDVMAVAGSSVTLEFKSSLDAGLWEPLDEVVMVDGQATVMVDRPADGAGFWRAVMR